MISLSKRADYGLLLLTLLGRQKGNGYVSIKKVADEHTLPYKYLAQIAVDLKEAQLIESKEGVTGGYRLKVRPESLMISDALRVLEGELLISCGNSKACACDGICVHKGVMERVLGGVEDYTLAELMKGR